MLIDRFAGMFANPKSPIREEQLRFGRSGSLSAAGNGMMRRIVRCYAEGREGDWEAICLDLDIAVQGGSFEDVFHALNDSVALHLAAVADLPEKERGHLLHRPAPFFVRLKFLAYVFRTLFTRGDDEHCRHQFTLHCPA